MAANCKVLRCRFVFRDLATQLDGGQGLTVSVLLNLDLSKGSRIPTSLTCCYSCDIFQNIVFLEIYPAGWPSCVLLNQDRSKDSRMPAQLELAAKVLRCQFRFSVLATQLDGQGLTNQDLSKGSKTPTVLYFSDVFFAIWLPSWMAAKVLRTKT